MTSIAQSLLKQHGVTPLHHRRLRDLRYWYDTVWRPITTVGCAICDTDTTRCDAPSPPSAARSAILKQHGVTPLHHRRLRDLRYFVSSNQVDVLKLNFKIVAIGCFGPFQVDFMPSGGVKVVDPWRVDKADRLIAWQHCIIIAFRDCIQRRTECRPFRFIITTQICITQQHETSINIESEAHLCEHNSRDG